MLGAFAFAFALPAAALAAAAAPATPSRGELLYSIHCIECHSTQVHWRELRLASDWPTLKAQVLRWQAIGQLGWSEAEVGDVTQYLNETIYHFVQPRAQARSGARAGSP